MAQFKHGIKKIGYNNITCYDCGKRTPVEHLETALRNVNTYRKNVVVALACGHAIVITSKVSFFAVPYNGDSETDDWGAPIRNIRKNV